MHRRQYICSSGAFIIGGFLAGCAGIEQGLRDANPASGPPSSDVPGVTEAGIDASELATSSRTHIESNSYDFGWVTVGEQRGRSFFRVTYDRSRNRLLLRNREGGIQFASFYTDTEAYRNNAPAADDIEHDRYSVPTKTLGELVDMLPAALERLTRVWISGYKYDSPVKTDTGLRLDIAGGTSQVPYKLANARGHILVSTDGIVDELSVEGVPLADDSEEEGNTLDTHMELSLSLTLDSVEVTEPDWVPVARERV